MEILQVSTIQMNSKTKIVTNHQHMKVNISQCFPIYSIPSDPPIPTSYQNSPVESQTTDLSPPKEMPVPNSDPNSLPDKLTDSMEPNHKTDFETKTNNITVFDHDLVIVMDSNGKEIITQKLYPNYSVKKVSCMTIDKCFQIMNDSRFKKEPKIVLLHFGTNDIEHNDQETVTDDLVELINLICRRVPLSKIIISALLPRKDSFNQVVNEINSSVLKQIRQLPNAHFLSHQNIHSSGANLLRNNKHLNSKGLKMFIVNIKDCILGRLGNTRINERRKQDGNSDYTDKRKGANSTKQGKMQTRRYNEKNRNWSPNLREKNIRPRQKHQAEEPDIPYYRRWESKEPYDDQRNKYGYNIYQRPNLKYQESRSDLCFDDFLRVLYEKFIS